MALVENLILEDSLVLSLCSRPDIIVEFPYLRFNAGAIKPSGGGCGGCAKRHPVSRARFDEAQRLKKVILGLDQPKKERLKQLLNAKRIAMYIPGPMGIQQHII